MCPWASHFTSESQFLHLSNGYSDSSHFAELCCELSKIGHSDPLTQPEMLGELDPPGCGPVSAHSSHAGHSKGGPPPGPPPPPPTLVPSQGQLSACGSHGCSLRLIQASAPRRGPVLSPCPVRLLFLVLSPSDIMLVCLLGSVLLPQLNASPKRAGVSVSRSWLFPQAPRTTLNKQYLLSGIC